MRRLLTSPKTRMTCCTRLFFIDKFQSLKELLNCCRRNLPLSCIHIYNDGWIMGKIAKYGTHLVHISGQIEMNDFAMPCLQYGTSSIQFGSLWTSDLAEVRHPHLFIFRHFCNQMLCEKYPCFQKSPNFPLVEIWIVTRVYKLKIGNSEFTGWSVVFKWQEQLLEVSFYHFRSSNLV